jgi:hypothetical protein
MNGSAPFIQVDESEHMAGDKIAAQAFQSVDEPQQSQKLEEPIREKMYRKEG